MAENKRYYIGNGENCTICDSNEGGSDFYNMLTQFEAVDRLNEQEELIKRLKTIREEQTETILKQKRKIKELEERNKRQYNRLKEITDLMSKRDWETLDNMVEEWEKSDELLEQEWGTYCENE